MPVVTRMVARDAITRDARDARTGDSSARSGAIVRWAEPAGATDSVCGVLVFFDIPEHGDARAGADLGDGSRHAVHRGQPSTW